MYNSFNQPRRMDFPPRSREGVITKCAHCEGKGHTFRECCQKSSGIKPAIFASEGACCVCGGKGSNRI